MSAVRAGWQVDAVDRFGDCDLAACCARSVKVDHYPDGIANATRQFRPSAWLYTGGLENHRDLIATISQTHRLLGNDPSVLARVRDPFWLADELAAAGLPFPSVRRERPSDKLHHWLIKPYRSGGGSRIQRADFPAADLPNQRGQAGYYFQRFVQGRPCSAVFVCNGKSAVLLGITEQILGDVASGTRDEQRLPQRMFMYAGSIGPLRLKDEQAERFEQIGEVLARGAKLVGLVGIDAILTDDDVWPVEVNPRYTASVEVIERGIGAHCLAAHVAACVDRRLPSRRAERHQVHGSEVVFGKAIAFADREIRVAGAFVEQSLAAQNLNEWPEIADIPHPGEQIACGAPIATVFAHGDSVDSTREKLADSVRRVRAVCGDT